MKNQLKPFKVSSRSNDLNWIGKTDSGDYVDDKGYGYQPVHESETADEQNYVTCVSAGCHADPSNLKPLNKKDKAFLESAYQGDISYCTVCNIAYDTETPDYDGEYQFTEDGLVCTNECFETTLTTDPDALKVYVDAPKQCIPLSAAETLETKGKLKHIERFIGGMMDGRGGSWAGEHCREGHPTSVLKELKAKYPKRSYVFSHDESGQFQTYFSVWRVFKTK